MPWSEDETGLLIILLLLLLLFRLYATRRSFLLRLSIRRKKRKTMLRTTLDPQIFFKNPRTSLPFSFSLLRYPLPICRNASTSTFAAETDSTLKQPPTSVYIHLPFCRKRCHYCDFPIVALGKSSNTANPETDHRILNYTTLLIREIKATKPKFNSDPALKTVFFGGGTPSLVPPYLISDLLNTLLSSYGISPDAEISIEMDPGTFDSRKLEELVGLGVNRVSLGVQAFQEDLLSVCGRAHGLREVEEAIGIVKGAADGLVNWSMDLISSLPNQNLEMWEESLMRAVDAEPTHVSVYDLQVEKGTKFGQLYTPGEFPLPTENQSAEFYKTAAKRLRESGYEHYEISSYCKSGFECKHNTTYWENQPFYAFGLGAASFLNGTRFSRPRRMKDYANYVQELEDGLCNNLDRASSSSSSSSSSTTSTAALVDAKDLAMDVVMLSLRTARGLDLKSFAGKFGLPLAVTLCKAFKPYVESNHVLALDANRRPLSMSVFEQGLAAAAAADDDLSDLAAFIRLSDPEGFLLSNELISTAFTILSP